MKVTCHTNKHLPSSVSNSVEYHANTRLNRFAPMITDVHATVTDENGPRGGVDIRCQLAITMKRGVKVQIRETSETVGEALQNAFTRASRTIARRLNRVRSARRASGEAPVAASLGLFNS